MNKILVLQLNRLGDLVQTVPLLCSLRQEYPKCIVTLVCIKGLEPLILDCGYFNEIIPVTLSEIDSLVQSNLQNKVANTRLVKTFFSEQYDFVINLTNDLSSSILMQKISSSKKRGRVYAPEGEIRLLGNWSKYLFSMVANRSENLFNLVDIQMGIAELKTKPQAASLPVLTANSLLATELLNSNGHVAGRSLIAIQSGASQLHRAWSLENFSDLSKRLLEHSEVEILLVGDNSEKLRAETIKKNVPKGVIDLVGKTSLPVLAAILQKCCLLISNDTGTIHIAAAVGTPTLGLYFSTAYFSETAPYGGGHVVLQVEIPCAPCHASAICSVQKCREYLTVDSVYQTSLWMLDSAAPTPNQSQNIGIYKSFFLTNGSLIYLPIHESVSSNYLKSLRGRLSWEAVFGMSTDPQIKAIWKLLTRNKIIPVQYAIDAYVLFEKGINLSQKLAHEFSFEAPSQERIANLHKKLVGLAKELATLSAEGGIVGAFLNFEMMDLDYAPYPKLADLLLQKYQHLLEISSRIKMSQDCLAPT